MAAGRLQMRTSRRWCCFKQIVQRSHVHAQQWHSSSNWPHLLTKVCVGAAEPPNVLDCPPVAPAAGLQPHVAPLQLSSVLARHLQQQLHPMRRRTRAHAAAVCCAVGPRACPLSEWIPAMHSSLWQSAPNSMPRGDLMHGQAILDYLIPSPVFTSNGRPALLVRWLAIHPTAPGVFF